MYKQKNRYIIFFGTVINSFKEMVQSLSEPDIKKDHLFRFFPGLKKRTNETGIAVRPITRTITLSEADSPLAGRSDGASTGCDTDD